MPERSRRSSPSATARPRARRRCLALAGALALAALLVPPVWKPGPLLVWNASASSPIGLYGVSSPRGLRAGDMAIAWPPQAARTLGAKRHYLPGNVPLVKRVGAAAGDTVCAVAGSVSVNGRRLAVRRRIDPAGRAMPWSWHGCERLREGDLLLLSTGAPLAFDGRYFGISRGDHVLGRARLLWPR